MKYLCVGEPYVKEGKEKMSWKRIGELFVSKAGKEYVKLYHIPNQLISVFEAEKQEGKTPSKQDSFGADLETPF
jgi:flavoprotein